MYKKIIESQKKLFSSQKTKSIYFRKKSLKKLLNNINSYEEKIYDSLNKDLKKHSFEAYLTEVYIIKKEIKLILKNLNNWGKPKRIKSSILNFPSKDYLIPEPYGITLHISPWNYPFQLAIGPMIGAVAAGNTVILKPSEYSINTSKLIEEIIAKSFTSDHVTVIQGDAQVASKLLTFRWDYIFFTGSTTVGKIVAKSAAINLTPYTLELGGKNPCIVDDSVPIELTAKRIIWGKFLNCGQTCIAPDYIIAKSNIFNKLLDSLIKEINKSFSDNSEDSNSYGRIINKKHLKRLSKMLIGEKIVYGGKINLKSKFMEPTIISNPSLKSHVMKEEIFGPILPIISYKDEEEIDGIINKHEKPLSFYVFSKRKSFIDKLKKKFSFGGGVVNDTIIQFINERLPFGGVGHSGLGSYHGKFSFDVFTHYKPFVYRTFWFDLWLRYAPFPKKVKLLKKILNKI
ncbi:MAG: aldehyde dehydrogenase family protein [Flavobacteriaceae bacterium]|nr:aldehyde dehydrogenase family protein [Flavobacteriaceae bacterium]